MRVHLQFHPLLVFTNFISSLRACGKLHSLQAIWIYCVLAYVHIISLVSIFLLHTFFLFQISKHKFFVMKQVEEFRNELIFMMIIFVVSFIFLGLEY